MVTGLKLPDHQSPPMAIHRNSSLSSAPTLGLNHSCNGLGPRPGPSSYGANPLDNSLLSLSEGSGKAFFSKLPVENPFFENLYVPWWYTKWFIK